MRFSAVSALSLYDAESEDISEAANRRKALRLTAQVGTVVAARQPDSFLSAKAGKVGYTEVSAQVSLNAVK